VWPVLPTESVEPAFDVLAAVRRLRADFPDLKVCLLSAYLDPSLVRDLLQAGIYGVTVQMELSS